MAPTGSALGMCYQESRNPGYTVCTLSLPGQLVGVAMGDAEEGTSVWEEGINALV